MTGELATIKSKQTALMQQLQERHAEGRQRLAILDELDVVPEKLVTELATTEEPAENFQEKTARLKLQFDPAQTEIATRKLT